MSTRWTENRKKLKDLDYCGLDWTCGGKIQYHIFCNGYFQGFILAARESI